MAIVNPNLQIKLTGDEVNNFTKTLTWEGSEQLENKINIVDTDGLVSVDYSFIDNVEALVFISDNNFIVTITAGGVTSTTTVTGLFLLSPESDYWDTITNISISTTNVSAISVETRIYGSTSS